MNDEELADYLNLDKTNADTMAIIQAMPAGQRKVLERMATLEDEVQAWVEGRGPKPKGVLIDLQR